MLGSDFARHFGVEPTTVSRWENGREPMGPAAERLLRVSAIYCKPVLSYEAHNLESVLDSIKRKDARPIRLKLTRRNTIWIAQRITA